MAEKLRRHYISTYEQVGFFRVSTMKKFRRKDDERIAKQGGNVVSYFCTPQGEVLNFIVGPTDPKGFRQAADWAWDSYVAISDIDPKDTDQRAAILRDRHLHLVQEKLRDAISTCSIYTALTKGSQRLDEAEVGMELARGVGLALANAAGIDRTFTGFGKEPNDRMRIDTVMRRIRFGSVSRVDIAAHLMLSAIPRAKLSQIEKGVFVHLAGEPFARRSPRSDELLATLRRNIKQREPTLVVVTGETSFLKREFVRMLPVEFQSPIARKQEATLVALRQRVRRMTEQREFFWMTTSGQEFTTLTDDMGWRPVDSDSCGRIHYVVINRLGEVQKVLNRGISVSTIRRFMAQAGEAVVANDAVPTSPPKVEKKATAAAAQLRLAVALVERNPSAAKRRLRAVIADNAGTEAAHEAARMLAGIK